jgi:hypothetical protein
VRSKNEKSEFTFKNNPNKERKKSNFADPSNKENEIFKKSLKDSSFKNDHNNNLKGNYNSNNKNLLENMNINDELRKSDKNKSKISFDIYPKSTKEIAMLKFAKYKKENDNKLLKKILKMSKIRELIKKSKQENSDYISNNKVDAIKKILRNAKKEKEKKAKIQGNKSIDKTTDSNIDSKACENKKEKKKNASMTLKNNKKNGEEFRKKLYAATKESDEANMNKFGLCTWCCKDSNRRGENNCLIF